MVVALLLLSSVLGVAVSADATWVPLGYKAKTPVMKWGVKSVAAGSNHSLVLNQNGTVDGWGYNLFGQVSIPVGTTGVQQISARGHNSAALFENGTVAVWGLDTSGQTAVPTGLNNIVAIALGNSHALALRDNGTVVAWGGNAAGQATVPTGLSDVVAIAAGESFSVALKGDGTVVAWGDNGYGQATVPSGLTGITAIATGSYHVLALRDNGTVTAWGANHAGQRTIPSGLSDVVALSAGVNHSLAVKGDGTLVVWGYNQHGQAQVPDGLVDVVGAAAGSSHSLVVKSDGSIAAWGQLDGPAAALVPMVLSDVIEAETGNFHTLVLRSDQTVAAWGTINYGQYTVPNGLSTVTSVAAGQYHSLALKADGTVVAWGNNGTGEINVPAGLTNVIAIGAHTGSVALRSDGTVVAWGTASAVNVPVGLSGVVAIAVGGSHTLALKDDGTVVGWGNGSNDFGQVTPPTGLTGVVAVAAGLFHSVALKGDGTVVCWGRNTYGESTVPAGLSGVVAISAGQDHTAAVKSDGSMVRWGGDAYGQVSLPSSSEISGVTDVRSGSFATWVKRSGRLPVVVSVPDSQRTFTGSPIHAAVSVSGGLAPDYITYNGSYTAPTALGVYAVRAVVDRWGYYGESTGTMTVVADGTAPSFTLQPASQTVTQPGAATFTSLASGSPTPTYQWSTSTDAGTTWIELTSETAASYTTPATSLSDNGAQFRVVASNGIGSPATSDVATLTVNAATTTVKINFQPAASPVPADYLADGGLVYGTRGNGQSYGWNIDHADVTRDRAISSDQRLDTLCHIKLNSFWEFAVANGDYDVLVSIGDAGYPSTYYLFVEGVTYWSGLALVANDFRQMTQRVTVTDGRLRLDQGSAPDKSTRLNYVEITPVSSGTAPSFTLQPASQTVTLPGTATFTSLASGSPAPTYQWSKSVDGGATWSEITGETAATYTTPATSLSDNGSQFRVVASNGIGSPATSDVATLTVNAAPTTVRVNFQLASAPIPADYLADGGLVYGSRGNGQSYGWNIDHADVTRDRGVNTDQRLDTLCHIKLNSFWEIAVANGDYDVLVSIGDAGFASTHYLFVEGVPYWSGLALAANDFRQMTQRVTVTDGRLRLDQGSAPDKSTRLNYIEIMPVGGGTAPSFTLQPASQTVTMPGAATFTSLASGSPSPTYQWSRSVDGGTTWTELTGETAANYTTSATSLSDNGSQYRVVASNGIGSPATSDVATLTVNYAPAFTTQPANQTVNATASATFTSFATGNPAPTYQWSKSVDGGATWIELTGENAATYTTPATSLSDNVSQYRVVASNGVGSPATSDVAILTVNYAPAFTAQPANQSVNVTTSATFTSFATGNPAPTYQWSKSADGGTTWTELTGETAATYTTPATSLSDNGSQYRVVASNGVGSPATSDIATLTVLDSGGTNPIDWEMDLSGTATFAADYQTGSGTEFIDGVEVHYTKNPSVSVSVTGSSISGSDIESVTIYLGDLKHKVMGSSGTWTFTVSERAYDLTIVVAAYNSVGSGTKVIDIKKRMVVDRTSPTVAMLLPKRFWPTGDDHDGRFEYDMGASLQYINDQEEAWNYTYRTKYKRQWFGRSDLADGLIVAISDATGLDTDSTTASLAAKTRDANGAVDDLPQPQILNKNSTNEDKPVPGQASTEQRLLITGIDSIPESYTESTTDTDPGVYRLQLTLEDKAGNVAVDTEATRLVVDITPPSAPVDLSGSFGGPFAIGGGGQTSPFRSFSPSFKEACEFVWQGSTPTDATMLRRSPSGSWRNNQPVSVAATNTEEPSLDMIYGYGIDIFTFADSAGNIASQAFKFQYYLSGEEYSSALFSIPLAGYDRNKGVDEIAVFRPDTDVTPLSLYDYSTFYGVYLNTVSNTFVKQPYTSFKSFMRVWDGGVTPRAGLSTVTPYHPEVASQTVNANNLLINPAILTVLPSWKPKTISHPSDSLEVRVVDKPGLSDPAPYSGHIQYAQMNDPSEDTTAALTATGLSRQLRPSHEHLLPGFGALAYGYAQDTSTPYFSALYAETALKAFYKKKSTVKITKSSLLYSNSFNAGPSTSYSNVGEYWANVIKVTPDTVTVGKFITVTIEAGFFTELDRPNLFNRLGDYVHFRDGETDITVKVADYPSQTPAQLAGKIAIVEQRMIYPEGNMWRTQQLELIVRVDPLVATKLYNIDVKLGAVREYADTLSQAYKGASGTNSHRIKNGFCVLGVDLQEAKQWDTEFASGFTVERTQPLITITNPVSGGLVSVDSSSSDKQAKIEGYVDDLVGKLTGTAPTLTLDSVMVPLTDAGNGRYTFTADASFSETGKNFYLEATNAFGVAGGRGVVVAAVAASSYPPAANPPTEPGASGNWAYKPYRYMLAFDSITAPTSLSLTQVNVATGASTTHTLLKQSEADSYVDPISQLAVAVVEFRLDPLSPSTPPMAMQIAVTTGFGTPSPAITEYELLYSPGLVAYASQAAELKVVGQSVLSDGSVDSITVDVYKPFAAKATFTLTETAVNSLQFTGGGRTVQLSAAPYRESDSEEAVAAFVTDSALGLVDMPIRMSTADVDVDLTWFEFQSAASSPLVYDAPDGPSDLVESYIGTVNAHSDSLPPQRAKKLVLNIPNPPVSAVYDVTTRIGKIHRIEFTRVGQALESNPLAYDAAASGDETLSAWPVKWELVSFDDGGVQENGQPPKEWGEVPDLLEVHLVPKDYLNKSAVAKVYVRRLKTKTDQAAEFLFNKQAESTDNRYVAPLTGDVLLLLPLQPRNIQPDPRERITELIVDKDTHAYFYAIAEAYNLAEDKFSDRIPLSKIFTPEDLAGLDPAHLAMFGIDQAEATVPWPTTLAALGDFSAGAAEGAIEGVWEDIKSPYELLKGIYALACMDWSEVTLKSLASHVGQGAIDTFTSDFKNFHAQVKLGNWNRAGFYGAKAMYMYTSILVPGLGQAKALFLGGRALANGAKLVAAADKAEELVKRYRKERGNDNRPPKNPVALVPPKRVPIKDLIPPALEPMKSQGPYRQARTPPSPGRDSKDYLFPQVEHPKIEPDGRRILRGEDGVPVPIVSVLDANTVKPRLALRFKVEKLFKDLWPEIATFSGKYERGHIHADCHNGRPDIPENFVPILDSINGGVMSAFEVMVRNKALDGNVVEYRRIITYVDNPANAAERLIPKSIQLEAYIDGKLIAQTPVLDNWGGKLSPTP